MTISLYEQFTGINWQSIANNAGTGLVLICLGAGIFDMFVGGHFLISFLLVLVGLLIACWELPAFFVFIPQSIQVTDFLINTLKLNVPATRAVVYLLLAILFLHGSASCVFVGLVFLVCSILNVFAQLNFQSDLADGTIPAAVPLSEAAASGQELLDKKNKQSDKQTGFGTF